MSRILITLALLAVAAHGAQQKVNPVQKVISLLEKMQTETQEEGKAEAAAYDKFACFCKDTADAKLHSITKGKEHIATLTAEIEALVTASFSLVSSYPSPSLFRVVFFFLLLSKSLWIEPRLLVCVCSCRFSVADPAGSVALGVSGGSGDPFVVGLPAFGMFALALSSAQFLLCSPGSLRGRFLVRPS